MINLSFNSRRSPVYGRGGIVATSQPLATTAWTPAQFNGQHTFPLNHGGGATCATCHPAGFTTYTCYGCHEHEEAEVIERHLDKDIPNFQNCMSSLRRERLSNSSRALARA